MKTYFGVWYEFYKDGSLKSGIIPKEFAKKPREKKINTPICTAYEYWFFSESLARKAKANIDRIIKIHGNMPSVSLGFIGAAA